MSHFRANGVRPARGQLLRFTWPHCPEEAVLEGFSSPDSLGRGDRTQKALFSCAGRGLVSRCVPSFAPAARISGSPLGLRKEKGHYLAAALMRVHGVVPSVHIIAFLARVGK